MNAVDAVVLAAYATLVIEMTCFPIPSEASTWQLLVRRPGDGDDELARARRRPPAHKVLLYLLPTALGIGFFLVPLACVVFADLRRYGEARRAVALTVAGLALIVLGRLVTFTSVLQLRASRRAGDRPPRGLFGRSRNPGLVGMFTLYAGLCLVCAIPWLWLGLPLYVANMHRRVRLEEAHLSAQLGAAWAEYAARVPRYLPLPGLR